MDDNGFAFLAAMGIVFGVFLVIIFIFYLVDAIAKFKYLKVRSYENSWMAFIPIANIWAVVEATYGNSEKINVYGWEAPAIVLKLWPVVAYILALVINVIPGIGNALSLILTILNYAVLVMIYKDVMEKLNNPQDGAGAILAVVINIISSIMIITTAGKFQPGEQDYRNDDRVLNSQAAVGGPLSFLNGK